MDLEEKIEILHEVADEIGGDLWDNYSGRYMYGLKCYGIVCDEPVRCIEHAAVHGITGASYDNMGLQYIVYWPRIRPVE